MATNIKRFIALVAVVVALDGLRKTFQPGEEVTGLGEYDTQDLLRCGAIQDAQAEAAQQKLAERAEKEAQADYERERKNVQARQAAIAAAGNLSLKTS